MEVNCRKCGAELHEKQKTCLQCGAPTPAGGGFYVEEKPKWQPSKNLKIGAAVVGALILLALVLNALKVTPPEVVAEDWFDAMVQRKLGVASEMATPKLEQELIARNYDLRALSDEYYTAVQGEEATYSVAEPIVSKKTARTTISLEYPDGHEMQVFVRMAKVGRQWKINAVD